MSRRAVGPWLAFVIVLALAWPRYALADAADDQFAVAAGHYSQQRWDLAADEFREFLAHYPDHARAQAARFYLGEALVQQGEYAAARDEFRQLLQNSPDGQFALRALYRSGESAFLGGDRASATADLQDFVERHPDDPLAAYALTYLGELSLADGRTDDALRWYSTALSRFPDGPLRADCLLGLGRAEEARQAWDQAEIAFARLAAEGNSALAQQGQFHLGLVYYNQNQFDRALATWKVFDDRLATSRLRPRVELARGWALFRNGQFDAAAAKFTALADDPDLAVQARYWLGMAQRAEHKWTQAAATLESVAQSSSDAALTAAARFHAADSLLAAGGLDQAARLLDQLQKEDAGDWADDALAASIRAATLQKDYARVVELAGRFQQEQPQSPLWDDVQRMWASALVAQGSYQDAIPILQRLVAGGDDNPLRPRAMAELAIAFARGGRLADAKPVLQTLVDGHADQDLLLPTIDQVADAAHSAGDSQYAGELYRRLADPANPQEFVSKGLSGLAWSQLESQDLAGSDQAFEKLMDRYPDDARAAEAALARAKILQRQNQPDPALALYHRVITDYPTSSQVGPAMLAAARLHEQLKQYRDAIALYEALLARPDDGAHREGAHHDEALYGLAWAMRESGNIAGADERLRELRDKYSDSPHWPAATYLLAESALQSRAYDQADQLLAELLKAQPEADLTAQPEADLTAKARFLRGNVAAAAERWDDTAKYMREMAEAAPENPLAPAAWFWVAEAAYRQNKLDLAARRFAELGDLLEGRDTPWSPMISLRRAQILARQEKWSAALDLVSGILDARPDFNQAYEVHYLIGRCLASRGEMDSAREAYRAAIAAAEGIQTETAAMAQWMIGESYMHQEQFEPAYREYLRGEILYTAYPAWRARSLLQAGKCAERLEKWTEATQLYKRLIKEYPDEPVTADAKSRLILAERNARG